MDEKLLKLEGKISKLEDYKIAQLEEKVNNIQIDLERNNVLTENSIKTQEIMSNAVNKMSDTMDSVKLTMCQLSGQIETNTKVVDNIGERMVSLESKVDNKIEAVENKINQVDDKGKIDTSLMVKDIIIKLIIGGGAAGGIFALLQYLLK